MKRGFAELHRRFEKSIKFDEWNARFASYMQDRSEARAAFARIDNDPRRLFTHDREMSAWRK